MVDMQHIQLTIEERWTVPAFMVMLYAVVSYFIYATWVHVTTCVNIKIAAVEKTNFKKSMYAGYTEFAYIIL